MSLDPRIVRCFQFGSQLSIHFVQNGLESRVKCQVFHIIRIIRDAVEFLPRTQGCRTIEKGAHSRIILMGHEIGLGASLIDIASQSTVQLRISDSGASAVCEKMD